MSLLATRFPGLALESLALGTGPTPVGRLDLALPGEVWVKDEGAYGDGGWGGNKVRKLEWIIPEARRRGRSTLFTVGGIGTHWGLACALYGREHGLDTVLGLVDQPVDEHVRQQLARLEASGATVYRYPTTGRLKLAAPRILARHRPWYLPAGGSNAFGTLGYVETALEIAGQVEAGDLPEPGTVVVPVGSGGTVAGLALGFAIAGLRTRVFGAVVNDMIRLDDRAITRLVARTAALLSDRGAGAIPRPDADRLTLSAEWLGSTYGDPTPASVAEVERAAAAGMEIEPVYTGKALAATRDLLARGAIAGPVLWLRTHGPR
ncbi:MAG TPA: pyridoxal-phosphate dependent enzyme [Marmoricola sp.]